MTMAGGKAGGTGKKDEPAKAKKADEEKKPTPSDWDELYQGGDIATPKRVR